jgi:hypothetical protein
MQPTRPGGPAGPTRLGSYCPYPHLGKEKWRSDHLNATQRSCRQAAKKHFALEQDVVDLICVNLRGNFTEKLLFQQQGCGSSMVIRGIANGIYDPMVNKRPFCIQLSCACGFRFPSSVEVVEEVEPTFAAWRHGPGWEPTSPVAGQSHCPVAVRPGAAPPASAAATATSCFFCTNQPARYGPALRRRNVRFRDPFRFRLD